MTSFARRSMKKTRQVLELSADSLSTSQVFAINISFSHFKTLPTTTNQINIVSVRCLANPCYHLQAPKNAHLHTGSKSSSHETESDLVCEPEHVLPLRRNTPSPSRFVCNASGSWWPDKFVPSCVRKFVDQNRLATLSIVTLFSCTCTGVFAQTRHIPPPSHFRSRSQCACPTTARKTWINKRMTSRIASCDIYITTPKT